jgi:hypothetical protein
MNHDTPGDVATNERWFQVVAWTPEEYLGTRKETLVPAPGAVSTTRP